MHNHTNSGADSSEVTGYAGNRLEKALLAAAIDGGAPPRTYEFGPEADIRLGEGQQPHLLAGATITHWTRD